MSEWIVDIETAEGVSTDVAELERFALALDAHEPTAGTPGSINVKSGVVSATFTVEASDAVRATELCVNAFREALSSSGLTAGDAARVVVERAALGDAIAV